jgi:DNA-3-methyladenine glycosylase II
LNAAVLSLASFRVEPQGPFSLEEAALFGFGQRHDEAYDGTMRLAFCLDSYAGQAAVAVTQDATGTVTGTITGSCGGAEPAAVAAQVARVLSLDHDARSFVALGGTDPVLASLLAAAPGLRPVLFYSPYEAAFWAVLSARRNRRTGETWRRRIAQAAGEPFEVEGQEVWALPTPAAIVAMGPLGLVEAAGIEAVRAERLCGVAAAALDGTLDAASLAAMDAEEARRLLRTVPGIGPFSADLILVRATGVTDVLPLNEPRLLGLMGELWGLRGPATPAWASAKAESWSPWRTWVAVLTLAAAHRMATSRRDGVAS